MEQIKNIKYSVQAVILNNKNQILAVSRKDNHNDFGLVGGKKDECDYLLEDAIIREIQEETGLIVKREDLFLIFTMHKDGYMGYTYLVKKWWGEIHTDEPHIIKWTSIEEVINGSFGKWNELVDQSLQNMGIEVYSIKREALKDLTRRSQADDVNYNDMVLCKVMGCNKESLEYSKYCDDCYVEKYGNF